MKEIEVRGAIEVNLDQFAQRGLPRKPGDAEACLHYRETLCEEERALFDRLICEGNYAGTAAELVEVATGRERPQQEQVELAKAS